MNYAQLAQKIKEQAQKTGFINARIASCHLSAKQTQLLDTRLQTADFGQMNYLTKHSLGRADAHYILPQAQSVLLLNLPYWTETFPKTQQIIQNADKAYISRYALGRDYHKVIRAKLKELAQFIETLVPDVICRGVVDSAPLAEVAFAQSAGLGWQGKNGLLIQKQGGSLFFLGALLTSLPLPPDETQAENHCGRCTRCITACPTRAIVAPHTVEPRRCLSYQTIENQALIEEPYRKAMGNRIYGCDDCQLCCPFNRFMHKGQEADFQPRHQLDDITLLELLVWTEAQFTQKMAGSPIYRIGYIKWLSNIIIALGNAPKSDKITNSLKPFLTHSSVMLQQAAQWALEQQHVTP